MNKYPMGLRRLRRNHAIRELLSDVQVLPNQLIQPYFICEELKAPRDLPSLYGQKQHTLDSLLRNIEIGLENKINNILLFVIPKEKSDTKFNYGFDQSVFEKIKQTFQDDVVLFADLCLCSNTLSGHCGIVSQTPYSEHPQVDNASSVSQLTDKAIQYAQSGVDVISPSDMMDSRIKSMRDQLDENHLNHVMIMSYSTKYSSSLYGPFRQAADSTPQFGDRKSYQIDPRNQKDAMKSSLRDADEGADILMVKPAGFYLDIIQSIKTSPQLQHYPLCAYQVSGEYQSYYLMEQNGLAKFKDLYYESIVAIRRAGADMIITYGANEFTKNF